LVDQGTDRLGRPDADYMPGMHVRAGLTVVADGPVGAVGRQIDDRYGMPPDHHRREWAVGMKMVVELPADAGLEPGTVVHTFGYPEPEIFGFLYVYPGGVASLGIFVPSWFSNPVRASYRYLQLDAPSLWRF
jgi:electron-transferring-flavoprotein dehydrogenase